LILRGIKLAAATGAALGMMGAVASAASGPPPPPTSTNGQAVQTVASGLGTPTSFAFGGGNVFESDGGVQDEKTGKTTAPGGVFLLKDGKATRLAGSPGFSPGIVWHKGTLYVSAINEGKPGALQAWSGWNGTTFTKQKTIYTGPKGFMGFSGLAFAKGRIWGGAFLAQGDHGPAKAPFQYDYLSVKPNGKGLKVVARGIRQPWQSTFAKGHLYVSDLGQDSGAKNPLDAVLRIKKGDDYGFPKCSFKYANKKACKGLSKPFQTFAPHTDVMGLGAVGKTLYMSEFLGNGGQSGLVQYIPLKGGTPKTLLTGFVAPIVGLATNGGYVYVGELTGQVFRVKVG
jgi:hypothetical protein